MNQQIYNKFKSSGIVTAFKGRRLEWLGHVVRMGGTRNYWKTNQVDGGKKEDLD